MNAIEFEAVTQNGMIKIPREHDEWYNKSLRVILLAEPIENTENTSISVKEIQAFFASKRLDLRDYQFNREEAEANELRPEYQRSDFGKLVRGKYASRLSEREIC